MSKYPKSLAAALAALKESERKFLLEQECNQGLGKRVVELQEEVRLWTERAENNLKACGAAQQREKATREQFDDLKKRVHDLEIENAQMTGYLNRVQEDDEVREELVRVGDPNGEETLVPKRKPHLNRIYSSGPPSSMYEQAHEFRYHNENRPKPKHWVNY